MHCLGCGSELSQASDRRALGTATDVAVVWRQFVENEADDEIAVNIDAILSEKDRILPKMCRKCFYSYKKLIEKEESIRKNLRQAATVLGLFSSSLPLPSDQHPPTPKRRRISSVPTQSRQKSGSSSQSPDVVVCLIK